MSVIGNVASFGIPVGLGAALGGGLALATRDDDKKFDFTSKEIGRTIRNTAIGVIAPAAAFMILGTLAGTSTATTLGAMKGAALLGGLGTAGYQISKNWLN